MERSADVKTKEVGVLYKMGSTVWWGTSSLAMVFLQGVRYLASTAINLACYLGTSLWRKRAEEVIDLTPGIKAPAKSSTGVDKDGFSEVQVIAPGFQATDVGIAYEDCGESQSDSPQPLSEDTVQPTANITAASGVLDGFRSWVGLHKRTNVAVQGRG